MHFNKSHSILFFLLAAIVVIPLSILVAQQQHAAGAGKDLYGISGHLVSLSTTDLNRSLDDYKALGIQWVRDDFEWPSMQPSTASSYDWTSHDAFVTAATARGIKILGIIDYTPQWELPAGCTDQYHCPPKSNTDYANFAAALAKHYGPMGVHTWEIWNEPNGGTFTVANYTALIKAAYPAIKQADATAFVLAGSMEPSDTSGTSYAPVDFLSGMYQNGGKPYFDAVSHHPYCYSGTSNSFNCPKTFADWSAWSQMQDTNPSLRSVMTANGDQNKKIWATEFGAPTGGTGTDAHAITETQQAQMVTNAYTLFNSYSWAGPLFWYTYQDPCTTTTDLECYFGLVHTSYSPKPAYTAYKNLTANSVLATLSPTNATTFSLTLCPHGLGNCGDNISTQGGNTTPKHTTRNITITTQNASTNQVASISGSVTYNTAAQNFQGTIGIPNLSSGNYLVSVKMDGFLKKQLPGIISVNQGQTTTLPSITVINDDINNDNQIDVSDYNLLFSCFGSKFMTASCLAPTTNQSAGADINDDGQVDGGDYNLFLRELSVQQGE